MIHLLGKCVFNATPDTGECTARTIESKMDHLLFCLKRRRVNMQQQQNMVRAFIGEMELWQCIGLELDHSGGMVREGFLEGGA